MGKAMRDIATMSGRCLRMTFRNSEAIVGSTLVPIMILFLFVYVFGTGAYDMQAYINAQAPSVIIVILGFSAQFTTYSVNSDMQKGIIDRFRSMPLFQPSVLTGHVIASILRSVIATSVVIGAAFVIGFRPQAGALDWALAIGIMFLVVLMMTWIFILIGLITDSPEGASSFTMLVSFLPFLSAGFANPDYLVLPLRVFFAHQPFTPIIEAIRGLTMGVADRSDIVSAVIWCVALTLVFYTLSVRVYRRKTG